MTYLAILLVLGASPADLPALDGLAQAAEAWGEPDLILAMASVESGLEPKVRSGSGACCWLGLLGGRYGNPSCKALEADTDLCVAVAMHELGEWGELCGSAAALDAYNGGWRKCWGRAGKGTWSKCKRDGCRSYGRKVRALQAKIATLRGLDPTGLTEVVCVVGERVFPLALPPDVAAAVVRKPGKGATCELKELEP